MFRQYKCVKIRDLGNHHSGIHNGWMVEHEFLPNTRRRKHSEGDVKEYAEHLEGLTK